MKVGENDGIISFILINIFPTLVFSYISVSAHIWRHNILTITQSKLWRCNIYSTSYSSHILLSTTLVLYSSFWNHNILTISQSKLLKRNACGYYYYSKSLLYPSLKYVPPFGSTRSLQIQSQKFGRTIYMLLFIITTFGSLLKQDFILPFVMKWIYRVA